MGLKGRDTYVRKTNPQFFYKWTPFDGDKTKKKSGQKGRVELCNAVSGSQGYDNKTNYVYKIVNGERSAYVECDYVK